MTRHVAGWIAVFLLTLVVFCAIETAQKFVWASHLHAKGIPIKGKVIDGAKTGAEGTGLRELILGERFVQVSWSEGDEIRESTMHVQRHIKDGEEVALLVDPADRSRAQVVDRLAPAWQFAGLSTLLGTIFVLGLVRSTRGTRQHPSPNTGLASEPT